MRHAPFGRPRHPLGTFPCGKVPRPPAGGRNLSQETDSLWKAGNGPTFLFPASQRISPLRRRPKGFPIALWKPSGAIPVEVNGSHKKWIPWGRQGKELYFLFPVSQELSPLRRRPGGFPVAPWTPSEEGKSCAMMQSLHAAKPKVSPLHGHIKKARFSAAYGCGRSFRSDHALFIAFSKLPDGTAPAWGKSPTSPPASAG